MTQITIGAASDPGQKRGENQDSHAFHVPQEGSAHRKGVLLALADGMGGHSGGAVASKTAIDALMETYYAETSGTILESLEKAFQQANRKVIETGKKDLALQGLGSTLTAAVLKDDRMYFAHVGDSRGYIIYDHAITQFTEDHSYVASLVKAGVITAEQAETHPEGNIITRAIGADESLQVDVSEHQQAVRENQYILICCDGLYRVVKNEEIIDTVYAYKDPDAISQKLVDMANANGGPDNITVLIARIDSVRLKSGLFDRILRFLR